MARAEGKGGCRGRGESREEVGRKGGVKREGRRGREAGGRRERGREARERAGEGRLESLTLQR
eukprot:3051334-Rhodomonas_salina.3